MTSDPASGSVIPNPPTYSAVQSFSMYLRFASSVPYLKIVYPQPSTCMFTCTLKDDDAFAISSVTIMAASHPILSPPYSSGITVPKKPSSPIGLIASLYGKW